MVENEEHIDNIYAEAERNGLLNVLSKDEACEAFDQQARRYLNMSGEEFLHALDAGEFDDDFDRPEVIRVWMLLPFVR